MAGVRRSAVNRSYGRRVRDVQCVGFRGSPSAGSSWSSVWYLLSAFAVISYTKNWVYVVFAAIGSWVGAYLSMTLLRKATEKRLHH